MSERGRLEVTVDGNASGFQQVLNASKQHVRAFAGEVNAEVTRSFGGFGKSLLAGFAAGFSLESIKGFIEGVFQQAGALKDISEQFDISVDEVGRWEKALDKAGVSTTKFYRALETLRAKRQEMREDPTKGSAFDALGLRQQGMSAAVSDTDLMKMILRSGGTRSDINALLGAGGARLKPAAEFVDSATPALTGNDIEDLDKAEKNLKSITGFFKKIATMSFVQGFEQLDPSKIGGAKGAVGKFMAVHKWLAAIMNPAGALGAGVGQRLAGVESPEDKSRREQREADEKAQREADAREADLTQNEKELAAQNKAQQESKQKNFEAEERLKDAQRRNMTAGARRESLQGDLAKVNQKIANLEGFGDELTDSDKLKLTQLKTQREGLMGELKQAPVSLSADSLAKSGLFAGSALNFSTDQSTQKQQLTVLREIATNTKNTCFNW